MLHRHFSRKGRRLLALAALGVGLLVAGCGPQYVVLHPVGPVGRQELSLMEFAAIAMAAVILIVFVLFGTAVVRFRDYKGNKNPYRPDFHDHRLLETLWIIVPAVILAIIAVPTVKTTYALAKLPAHTDPVTIDVTSLDWKWLFQYPNQKVATVNYAVIPTGKPVLFELTADSPMNTFWVPQLGGMEYTMPGRVLPLWLQANKAGVYWGHSGQFSGVGFEKMFFHVKAVTPTAFQRWASHTHATAAPMTMADYHRLLHFTVVGKQTYASYPKDTFPSVTHGFSLSGGMYLLVRNNPNRG